MSRWADSTDDDDDYLNEGDHEDYVDHAVGVNEVSISFTENTFGTRLLYTIAVSWNRVQPLPFMFCHE